MKNWNLAKEAAGDLVQQENNNKKVFFAGTLIAAFAGICSAAVFAAVAFDLIDWFAEFMRGMLGYTAYVLPIFTFAISSVWIFCKNDKKEKTFSLSLFFLAFLLVNSAVYTNPEKLSWYDSGVYLNSGGAIGEFVTSVLSLGLGSGFALGLAFVLIILGIIAGSKPEFWRFLKLDYGSSRERNIVTMLADYNDYGKRRVRDKILGEDRQEAAIPDMSELSGIVRSEHAWVKQSAADIAVAAPGVSEVVARGATARMNFLTKNKNIATSEPAQAEASAEAWSEAKTETRAEAKSAPKSASSQPGFRIPGFGKNSKPSEKPQDKPATGVVPAKPPVKKADAAPAFKSKQKQRFNLPPAQLLDMPVKSRVDNSRFIEGVIEKLHGVFKNFGIDARVVAYEEGPTITMFEVALGKGVKIAKLQNLSDDIALSLAVPHVRIAPVDGKSNVGIEVPNGETRMVTIREVTDTSEFSGKRSPLSVALGLDISGKPVVGDLTAMPHLLVAGSTGSGKSVCINSMILSILLNATPDEVRFIMIDPKQVELSNYNDVPHLLMPVVTDPRMAATALNWAVQEMERRYNLMFENKTRNHKDYNEKCAPSERLPLIVIIVDELADLMMVAAKQVEEYICRIAQKARAAGMHLVVATQRPSVDVITGLIKANIPSRIAFSVSSQVDSRTILDASGAEHLLGKGDMLYHPAVLSRPKRVQGVFVSNKEIENVIAFIERQNFAAERIELGSIQISQPGLEGATDDEYLEEAIRFVREQRKASASMLQRKFSIGYNRAARLIDIMEEMGVIGAQQGSKPREVYK